MSWLSLGLLLASQGHAADFDYEASAGIAHSDNIRRVETDKESEEMATAGLRFSLWQQGTRLRSDMLGNFLYVDYLGNAYDFELQGNFAGNAVLAFIPERFEWVVSDNFGQILNDPLLPPTPDNRENINYFTTGPDLMLGLGTQNQLRIGARYTLSSYEHRPLDSDQLSGEMSLIRQLSQVSAISLNGRLGRVKFDESVLNADYDQADAFVRYDVTGARTHLAVDAGYTRIKREDAAGKQNGALFRLDASRRLSPSTTATLSASRQFANSANAFALSQGSGVIGVGAAPGQQTAQPFTNDLIMLGGSFFRERTGFAFSVSWNDQSYENLRQFDQTLSSASASFRRDLSPKMSLLLDAMYSRGEFNVVNGDYNELIAGLTLNRRLTRNMSLQVRYNHSDRNSDLADRDYRENRVWLSFAYGRGNPRDMPRPTRFAVDQRAPGMSD
jgi:hypothetical protein